MSELCYFCKGKGHLEGSVTTTIGQFRVSLPCWECDGKGLASEQQEQWRKEGQEFQNIRVRKGLAIGDAAIVNACNLQDLVKWENGLGPKPF